MTRTAGKTSLILGPDDVSNLLDCVERRPTEQMRGKRWEELQRLRRRLKAAESRLARGRNGRSEQAS